MQRTGIGRSDSAVRAEMNWCIMCVVPCYKERHGQRAGKILFWAHVCLRPRISPMTDIARSSPCGAATRLLWLEQIERDHTDGLQLSCTLVSLIGRLGTSDR